jgi:hypothetical protein
VASLCKDWDSMTVLELVWYFFFIGLGCGGKLSKNGLHGSFIGLGFA